MAPERGELLREDTAVVPCHDLAGLPLDSAPMIAIKEEEGGMEALARNEDDDLTSLTWLQDKNLLKGINLRSNGAKQESPPSDYIEDSASESTCSSVASSPLPPNQAFQAKNKHPHHIPYDPKVHVTSKPPYSFSCLIFMSIESSSCKALPVKEIYAWILDHFPYYRTAPNGWKNSVRHNLSLNKCFRKVDKAPNLGKGSLWMVDPVYRPNLVQALMKAPYHPYIYMEKSINENHRVSAEREQDANGYSSLDEIDDVDAAKAMLALKHGPYASLDVIQRIVEEYRRSCNSLPAIRQKELEEKEHVAVRHSEDHTYSADNNNSDSADEAFDSDSNSSWCYARNCEGDLEERRKTAEGADALLNLAGIRTWTNKRSLPKQAEGRLDEGLQPSVKHVRLTSVNNNTIKVRRKPALPHRICLKSKR